MKSIKLVISLLMLCYNSSSNAQLKKVNIPDKNSIIELLKMHKVPTVGVGIIEKGKIKDIKVYGELRKNMPAKEGVLFSVASQTKPVTAMMVLELVKMKLWDLDEPLNKYWIDPDVANDSFHKLLTTRHILSHSSGFANWRRNEPNMQLVFHFEPGTKFQYSGEGMEYLKKALENKFQMPFDKLLSKYLLDPLKMVHTTYWKDSIGSDEFAAWHDGNGVPYMVSYNLGINASGGLFTTIEDYCKLLTYVMDLENVSPKIYKELSSHITKIKPNNYYGIGWAQAINLPDNEYVLHHGGSDLGVRTNAVFLPNSERGVVIMTNGDNGGEVCNWIIKESLDIGEDILNTIHLSGKKRQMISLTEKDIKTYIGTYKEPDGRAYIVEPVKNGLKVSGKGSPTAILFPESNNTFFMSNYDITIEFIKTKNSPGYSMHIYENGNRVVLAKRSGM